MLIACLIAVSLGLQSPERASAVPAARKPIVAAPAAALEFAGFNDGGDARLVIDAVTVNRLNRSDRATLRLALSPIEMLTLDLQRFEVVAPDAELIRATVAGSTNLERPRLALFRGSVTGEPLSHAFIAISERDPSQGLGIITRQSGERWHIGTDRTGNKPWLTIRRGAGDVPDFDHFCSMIPLDGNGGSGGDGGLAGTPAIDAAGPRVLNVAIDSDERYWRLFDDDQNALDYAAMVMAAVNDIFLRDLNLRIALRFVRIWPTGGEPFIASSLSGFRDHWQKNEDLDGLNLIHMFSGARNTSYGGVAYLADACSGNGFGISAFMLGGFSSPIVAPHLGNWDVTVVAHEMGHNLGTPHTHDLDPPIDECATGTLARGTIMSYCHTLQGGALNIDMHMHSRIAGVIADANPIEPESCLWHDCNGNLINDVEDITFGASLDANADGIPDECQDCNGNSTLDPIDIVNGAPDVDANGVPDSCQTDCNGNGVPDRWECLELLVADDNRNNVPDTCEPDCDDNGITDFVDIANGTHTDIDRNSRPDACDDCNANGTADWIDFGRAHNIFIAQSDAKLLPNPIREYHFESGVLAGNYPDPLLKNAADLAFGSDRQLYAISAMDWNVVKINLETGAKSVFVTSAAAGCTSLIALTFGPDGSMYTACSADTVIRKFDSSGAFVSIFADLVGFPWDMAFGPNGNLFVLAGGVGVIELNGATGAYVGTPVPVTNFNAPRSMCFLQSGDLLVLNRGNSTIRRYSTTGTDFGVWNDESPLDAPWGMTLMPNGNVLIARRSNPVRIVEYTPEGAYVRSFIRGDLSLTHPVAIALRPPSAADSDENRILDICEDACPADVTPQPTGDGAVNVSDLLAVISTWGTCNSQPCPADCAPPGGDGFINVTDLLMIISNWGSCD